MKYETLAVCITNTYKPPATDVELFECTRGVWLVDRNNAERARYVFTVYRGVVIEVYEPTEWDRAGTTPYPTRPNLSLARRFEFKGAVASEKVRRKFVRRTPPRSRGQAFQYSSEATAMTWPKSQVRDTSDE